MRCEAVMITVEGGLIDLSAEAQEHIVTPPQEDEEKPYIDIKWLYEKIGCELVQRILTPDGEELWMDETGKLTGQPYNHTATTMYGKLLFSNDYFVGPIVVLKWTP